jgi:hypothetical protein
VEKSKVPVKTPFSWAGRKPGRKAKIKTKKKKPLEFHGLNTRILIIQGQE